MNTRRSFIKSLSFLGVPLFLPFTQIKERKNSRPVKTVTFLKIPKNLQNFSKIEDCLSHSANSNYWKAFRVAKSNFKEKGRLIQSNRIALGNGRFVLSTYYKTKRDHRLFANQIKINLLKKELSKANIHLQIKTIG